jgi:hypothetical protein
MNFFKLSNLYFIGFNENNELKWYEYVEQDDTFLVFEGEATVDSKNSILFLSPWEETYIAEEIPDLENSKIWDKTEYYATLTDSGNMKIFYVGDEQQVDEEIMKKLSSSIGCTMKYR